MTEQLLYITQVAGYQNGPAGVHRVLPQATVAMAQLAEIVGLDFTHVTDVRTIGHDELAKSRIIGLFTIGETPWAPEQKRQLLERLRAGNIGVLAQHSATDACYEWPEYVAMVGARFNGHPWTAEFTIEVADQHHPATAHLDERFRWEDEIYQFRDLRSDARILLQMRQGDVDPTAARSASDTRLPLAWCFEEGRGRIFYTALGHFPIAYEYPTYLRHLSGGLSWVLGHDR